MEYLEIAEEIYANWADQGLNAAFALGMFTLQHAPEPYLRFGGTGGTTVFLSTNPGKGFDYQLHPSVIPGGLFSCTQTYAEAARRAGAFYAAPDAPISVPARTNIRAMRRIAAALGRPAVMQVEALPWHSATFPSKRHTVDLLRRSEPIIDRYLVAAADFLSEQPVVLGWSAGSPMSRGGEGVDLKAHLLQLDLRRCELTPLEQARGTSQALLWQRTSGTFRGLFVNQGSATLPKRKSRTGQDKDELIASLIGTKSAS